jgi:hypothetical protein
MYNAIIILYINIIMSILNVFNRFCDAALMGLPATFKALHTRGQLTVQIELPILNRLHQTSHI